MIIIIMDKKIILFLFLCIPARLIIALGSMYIPTYVLKYYSILLLIIALSFLYLYISNKRLNAPEAGGITWWKDYRLLIGALYLVAAIYSFQGKRELIKYPLLMDILLGLFIFFNNHLKFLK